MLARRLTFLDYLAHLDVNDLGPFGDFIRSIHEDGRHPRTPSGLVRSSHADARPIADHHLAEEIIARYGALKAREPATDDAEPVAEIYRTEVSREGTRLAMATCATCEKTVLHGLGEVGTPLLMGDRRAHCGCDHYELVDPLGVLDHYRTA